MQTAHCSSSENGVFFVGVDRVYGSDVSCFGNFVACVFCYNSKNFGKHHLALLLEDLVALDINRVFVDESVGARGRARVHEAKNTSLEWVGGLRNLQRFGPSVRSALLHSKVPTRRPSGLRNLQRFSQPTRLAGPTQSALRGYAVHSAQRASECMRAWAAITLEI